MLVPAGAIPLDRGGLVLGCSLPELPRQVATTAGRLAWRLRTRLILTELLTGDWCAPPTYRLPDGGFRGPATGDAPVAGRLGSACDGHPVGARSNRAAMHEAALVVIAGRDRGPGLFPRRRVRLGRLHASNALPAIVTVTPAGVTAPRR